MKKKEKVGVISGLDMVKKAKPIQSIPFRTGGHQTSKDRPRKKDWKKSYRREDW